MREEPLLLRFLMGGLQALAERGTHLLQDVGKTGIIIQIAQ